MGDDASTGEGRSVSPVVRELRRLRARVAELELELARVQTSVDFEAAAQEQGLAPAWMSTPADPIAAFATAWSRQDDAAADQSFDSRFIDVCRVDEQARNWLLTGT